MMGSGLRSGRATAALAAIVTCVLAPQGASAAPSAPKTAAECRALTDFTERGLCWDALDRAGLHDETVVKKRNFGLSLNLPAAKPKPEKAKAPKRAPRYDEGVDGLTLTIASINDTPMGRIQLTSTDGAVWEQIDGDRIDSPPSPGDTVSISKGMLGGYMCQVTRWQQVRCQRDQ